MALSNIEAKVSYESIQVLDTTAATDTEYFYLSENESSTGKAGWFCDDFETPADNTEIKEGSSILFASQGTKSIPFSGKVATKSKSVTSEEEGFTMIGNNSPVAVELKDLVCENINSYDSIQFMDSALNTSEEYFYLSKDESPTGEAGWFYDDFTTCADKKEIPAGTGVLFSATAGSVTISFPVAL